MQAKVDFTKTAKAIDVTKHTRHQHHFLFKLDIEISIR